MADKKIKVLYDATFLLFFSDKRAKRSGIYFVAYNILKELCKNSKFEITLYGNYRSIPYIKNFMLQYKIFACCKTLKAKETERMFPIIMSYINFLCRKIDDTKDNLLKKAGRFFTYKYFYLHERINANNPKLKKTIKNFDVYFSPYEAIPKEILVNNHIKKFLFLHDAVPFVLDNFYKDMNYSKHWFLNLVKTINKNDYYFTNSECTKNDFIKYAPEIDKNKVFVTYLGANENFYRVSSNEKIKYVKQKYKIPVGKKYIFSLCTLEPRKNLIFALKNFVEFTRKNGINDIIFVLGGGHWDKFLKLLEKEIGNLGIYKDKILKIGYVADEDLALLYSGAEMFVYPSIYEGFGMPVLEAMQCGAPVITSNVSSLPEVIGDAGIRIDPYKNEELIAAYEKMYFDRNFREQCIQKSLERAKEFSWEKCVDIITGEIKKAAGK